MKISIGYSEDNDIVIKDSTVSRLHANLEIRTDKSIWIEDLNSKNGIYVNNRRIKKSAIDKKDQIILGGKLLESDSFFEKIEKIVDHRKIDFTDEYALIIDKMEEYHNRKSKITNPSKWPKIIRIGISLVLIIIIYFTPGEQSTKMILMMSAGMIPVLMSLFSHNRSKKQESLDLLRLEYEDDLKCPKCKSKLIQFTPVYMRSKGRCVNDKCSAEFKVN